MKKALIAVCIVLLLVLIDSQVAHSQQPLPSEKKVFVDTAGRYYQQASLPVYILIATAADGKAIPVEPVHKKQIHLEGHGVHTFKHENIATNETDEFKIYADGIAPVTTVSFSAAPAFAANGKQYYGAGLAVALKSTDEMSGVEETFHSINAGPFQAYTTPSFTAEGNYVYSYYATDRTGNAAATKSAKFAVDLTPPSSFHNFVGISSANVISTNSTIYLTTSDSAAGVAKAFYKFDKENFRPYAGGTIPFQHLADGDHTLTYYAVDNVKNSEREKTFQFYLDKTAPIMSADVLGDKFIVGQKVYFSGRTKLKLTAIDNKSGIKEVKYSINREPEISYTEPFYLPGRTGLHTVNFRAIDNTNNPVRDDFEHSVGVIYVDLTGPALNSSFIGPVFIKGDTVFTSPKTKVALSGNDPEAGMKKITYSFDGAAEETPYTSSIEMTKEGIHKLDFFGYDNVNNRNVKSVIFVIDTHGPEITSQQAAPANKEGKYPSYTTLYLSAMDREVGADQIRYSINGGKEQPYSVPVKGFAKNKEYTIAVTALDLLGNSTTRTIQFSTDKY